MSALKPLLDSLEENLQQIIQKNKQLKKDNEALREMLTKKESSLSKEIENSAAWKSKYNSLKKAYALVGGNEYKNETKFKINTLIKEIDNCIVQLSK